MNVRKNATSLTAQEWERFLSALVTLKHTFAPGSNVSVYDQFVASHQGVTNLTGAQTVDGAHGGPAFLPWHREYIRRFELNLQMCDSRVALPYWNWGFGGDGETFPLFTDDRMGPMGAGAGDTGQVTSGYFALNPNSFNPLGWSIHSALRPFNTALTRRTVLDTALSPTVLPGLPPWPTASSVNSVLSLGSYSQFRPALEWPPHGIVHVRIGADMGTMTSPNDPLFWLHHAQIDRIWARWQQDHPGTSNYNMTTTRAGHRLTDAMWPWDAGASQTTATGIPALLPQFPQTDVVRVEDVIDHRDLGYCYDDEPDCPCPAGPRPGIPTRLARGEEFTTLATGREVRPTRVVGEDFPTTLDFGEEGPATDPRIDDPVPPFRIDPSRPRVNPFGRF